MFERHVLRRGYDVSYQAAIALHASPVTDLLQLPQSPSPFLSKPFQQ